MKENKGYKPDFHAGDQPSRGEIQSWSRFIHEPEKDKGAGSDGAGSPWAVLWSNKWLLVCCSVACALVALGASVVQTPEYKAQTSLEIEDLNGHFLQLDEVDPVSRGGSTDSFLATQVDMLTSSSLIGRVVARLNLDKPYSDSQPSEGIFDSLRKTLGFRKLPQETPKGMAIADVKGHLNINASRGSSRVVTIEYVSTDPRSEEHTSELQS